eukprot:TRINITY_DN1532_c1_g1_i1.p1 TRINITY_DN1532_c1_g1~~TRINITY_DN1532_c1_g1_i1.p1  ORF type:complete len:531 (-),score=86.01 TRINITY_DN1532_c1_g1_i1:145-1737(-)
MDTPRGSVGAVDGDGNSGVPSGLPAPSSPNAPTSTHGSAPGAGIRDPQQTLPQPGSHGHHSASVPTLLESSHPYHEVVDYSKHARVAAPTPAPASLAFICADNSPTIQPQGHHYYPPQHRGTQPQPHAQPQPSPHKQNHFTSPPFPNHGMHGSQPVTTASHAMHAPGHTSHNTMPSNSLPAFLPLAHGRMGDSGSPPQDSDGSLILPSPTPSLTKPGVYSPDGAMIGYYGVHKGQLKGNPNPYMSAPASPGSPSSGDVGGRPDSPSSPERDGHLRKDLMAMYSRREYDRQNAERNGKRKRGQAGENNTEQAEEVRKERHNMAEKKRRSDMNDAIERLRALLPQQVTAEKRLTKVEVLIEAADHLTQVQNLCAKLIAENNGLIKQRPGLVGPVGVANPVMGMGVGRGGMDGGHNGDDDGLDEEEEEEENGAVGGGVMRRDPSVPSHPTANGVRLPMLQTDMTSRNPQLRDSSSSSVGGSSSISSSGGGSAAMMGDMMMDKTDRGRMGGPSMAMLPPTISEMAAQTQQQYKQ